MRKLWLVGMAGAALALVSGSGAQVSSAGASAHAYAIKIVLPGEDGAIAAEVGAPPDATAAQPAFAYPEDGSVVRSGPLSASATAAAVDSSANATASVEVQALSLFGGEILAASVTARARADAAVGTATGDLGGAALHGLVVGGEAVAATTPGERIQLGDWGYALLLAQGAASTQAGFRGFVTTLEVHLNLDHGGLPAGSAIYVGYAEAAAAATAELEAVGPALTAPAGQSGAGKANARKRSGPRRPLPALAIEGTPGGYVFPVHGPASFSNTFGAARAVVGWHHGEDIFAPLGAPVLAVADGTIFSAGWNDLGGNRLWLRDANGNEFYYAHMAAFTPLAVNGTRVRAGDVLGFVGASGDAEGTPPHLHFEIHPVGMLGRGYDGVITPYRYLLAWRRLEDVRFVAGAAWLPPLTPSTAPQAGAYLLSVSDISAYSGLEPGSLRRALVALPSSEAFALP